MCYHSESYFVTEDSRNSNILGTDGLSVPFVSVLKQIRILSILSTSSSGSIGRSGLTSLAYFILLSSLFFFIQFTNLLYF